ncbi:MAG: hypothetical protein HYU64_10070 [Armatimonadetes bacterium]|nr:hypothetical protein [Armatimonadota bacterium]
MLLGLRLLATVLLIAVTLSSTWAKENPPNIKPAFITAVRQYMVRSQGTGLSSNFFSVGNPDSMLPAVSSYLLGVAVDPEYLASFKWGQYIGWAPSREEGLCQPKGQWWTATVTPQEMRYNGWVVLANFPTDQGGMVAFHEAIHAYHLSIGSSVDGDATNGPEYISNNFYNIVMNLRTRVDPLIREIQQDGAAGRNVDDKVAGVRRTIANLRGQMSGWSPEFFQCLRNIGGKADWDGFEDAFNKAPGISGTWKSDWGPVTLQHGAIQGGQPVGVTGHWVQGPDKRGTFTGGSYNPSTGVVTLNYYEPWKKISGSATLTLSADGKTLSGTWKQPDGAGSWTMTR